MIVSWSHRKSQTKRSKASLLICRVLRDESGAESCSVWLHRVAVLRAAAACSSVSPRTSSVPHVADADTYLLRLDTCFVVHAVRMRVRVKVLYKSVASSAAGRFRCKTSHRLLCDRHTRPSHFTCQKTSQKTYEQAF